MNEQLLTKFQNSFSAYQEKRILLYGTGINAKAIIERYDDSYRILGILTLKQSKNILYGKHVFQIEDVEGLAPDLIIVTETEHLDRLLSSCPGNIPIYDLEGKCLNLPKSVNKKISSRKEQISEI